MTTSGKLRTSAPLSVQPLPRSVARVIDDADYPGIEPNVSQLTVPDLQRAAAIITAQLVPAELKHIRKCVSAMMIASGAKLTGEDADVLVVLWAEANGDLPADLWTEGTHCVLREHVFGQPKPADLRKSVAHEFARRLRRQHRVAYLTKLRQRLPTVIPFEREPEDVRLRELRESYRRIGRFSRSGANELRLAAVEQREPQLLDVEREALDAAPPPPPPPREIVHRESDSAKAARLVAVARHHAGTPYATTLLDQAMALDPRIRLGENQDGQATQSETA